MRKKTPLEARFWKYVQKTESCWLWTGAKSRGGYGKISPGGRGSGLVATHRLSLKLAGIDLPDDMVVDHKCRNPACVNPDHLRVVTRKVNSLENSMGASAINAQKSTCPKGHSYKDYVWRGVKGRICLECARLRAQARRDRTKNAAGKYVLREVDCS